MNKVIIITGATGGLGSATVRKFGAAGAKLVLADIERAQGAMEKLSEEINNGPKGSGQAFTYQADVRKLSDLEGMVAETVKKWGRIDVVVNTAGGTYSMLTRKGEKKLLEHTDEIWDLVIDVNLKGSLNCLKAVVPQMIKQKDGHIIMVSSGSSIRPGKLMSSYAAAKAGVTALAKAAANEFGEHNIKVNVVLPGFIAHWKGEELQQVLGGYSPEYYMRETFLGRNATPEDFADLVFFVAQTTNISGQTYNNDSRLLF
jgi:3-oxoacyl-[acyl-carrier protein] reductase